MIRNVLTPIVVVSALVLLVPHLGYAQLLTSTTSQTSIAVGTTTYAVKFPSSTGESARVRLSNLLYYLRTFDTPRFVDGARTYTVDTFASSSMPNTYVDIVRTVFTDIPEAIPQGASGTPTRACVVFSKHFRVGDRDPEVRDIQRFLNTLSGIQVARSGPGAPGRETDYFGPRTAAAVVAFQRRYADEILTPLGLRTPTGYWGASSAAHANRLTGCRGA